MMADSVIRAAGVVVVKGPRSNPRVLLIHRPRHDDWSLPKGKLDKGEHVVAAAVRECDEETGVVPILSVPLGQQQYQVLGRDKTVDYWRAHIGKSGRFIPNDEVDQCSWLHPHEAHERLTYARDNEFLDAALAGPKTWPLIAGTDAGLLVMEHDAPSDWLSFARHSYDFIAQLTARKG